MHPGQYPLAKFAPVALAACVLAIYYPEASWFFKGVLLVASVALLIAHPAYQFKSFRFVCWMLIGAASIFLYTQSSWKGIAPNIIVPNETVHEVTITHIKQQDSLRFRCWAQWQKDIGVEVFTSAPNSNLVDALPGDRLFLKTKFSRVDPPKNPGQFNYARYLAFHKVYLQAFLRDNNHYEIHSQPGYSAQRLSAQIRNFLQASYKSFGFTGETLGVAAALVFGDKSMLDHNIKGAYSAAGATHVLAVSGLHVGIVYLILLLVLRKKNHAHLRGYHVIILIMALWFYALVTGFSPSVQRAATMFSFLALAKGIRRQSNIFNLLGASIVFLVLINPLIVTEVGFQMSYLAVVGIVTIYPWINSLWAPNNKWVDAVWQISGVSLAAQIATGVLSFLYFRQFPTYFLISNLFVIPLATIVVWLGALTNVLLVVFPWLAQWSSVGVFGVISVLNAGVKWVESWPYALFREAHINFEDAFFFYALLLVFMFWLHHRKRGLVMKGQVLIIAWMVFPNTLSQQPALVAFSSNKDLWLVGHSQSYALHSETMQSEQIDFTAGRYLASLQLFDIPREKFGKWRKVGIGKGWIQFLVTPTELWIRLSDTKQLPYLEDITVPFSLFIKEPLWDVGCILSLQPKTVIVSNTLGKGYVDWLVENGISRRMLHFTKKDGPFIQL